MPGKTRIRLLFAFVVLFAAAFLPAPRPALADTENPCAPLICFMECRRAGAEGGLCMPRCTCWHA